MRAGAHVVQELMKGRTEGLLLTDEIEQPGLSVGEILAGKEAEEQTQNRPKN